MSSPLLGCCGVRSEEKIADCFSVLYISTLTSCTAPGCKQVSDDTERFVKLDNCCLLIREVQSIEKLTKKQIVGAQGIVFVLNSAGKRADVEEHAQVLRSVQEHPALCGLPFLLFATHQDETTAVSCDQLEVILGLRNIRSSRCLLMHCCAGAKPEAFLPGLEQLANELLKQQNASNIKPAKSQFSLSEFTGKTLVTFRRRKFRNVKST